MGQSVEVVVSELSLASARLEAAAQRLKDGLATVDVQTTELMGAGWKGAAASAYAPAWEKWHDGAGQVVDGLQRMSELLSIAGKEYAKTDESASGAIDSTIQASGGSHGGEGGDGGTGGGPGQASAEHRTGGAGTAASAGQSTGTAAGMQQSMGAAMQVEQVASQPLSQVGQGATGLAQMIASLAQEATQTATEAVQQAETASGEEDQQPAPEDSAAG